MKPLLTYLPSADRVPWPGAMTGTEIAGVNADLDALGYFRPLSQIHNRWFVLMGLYYRGVSMAEARRTVRACTLQHFVQPGVFAPILLVIPQPADKLWASFESLLNQANRKELAGLFKLGWQAGTLALTIEMMLMTWEGLDRMVNDGKSI